MTLSQKQQIFARNVAKLIEYIYDLDYSCTFGEVYRTHEQAEIYAKSGAGILNSLHCKRLAVDLNIFSPGGILLTHVDDCRKFGDYWVTLHEFNRAGMCFKAKDGSPKPDNDHYEMQDL